MHYLYYDQIEIAGKLCAHFLLNFYADSFEASQVLNVHICFLVLSSDKFLSLFKVELSHF